MLRPGRDTGKTLLACAALAASSLLGACGRTQAASSGVAPAAVPVRITVLERAAVEDTSEYVATLRSRRSVTLQPQVDGQVRRIFVKSGDVVREGTPIVQIDAARQAASVRSQEATRIARLADLSYARQQYERMQALFADGIVARQQLDQAKSTLESLQANVDALAAQVRQQQVQLQYFRVTAPAEGIVGDIPVREGDYVTPQTRLTTIDQRGALEAYVSVPVERAGDLRLGMPVVIVGRSGTKIADSRIAFISPQVNDETQSVLIKTLVDNPNGDLRPEQFTRARVVWSAREGLLVPVVAVTRLNGQPFAFVAQEERGSLVARQRPIEVGDIVGNSYVVLKGIEAGERVVVSGIQKLRDGAPVTPESEPPGPGPRRPQPGESRPGTGS